MAQHVSYTCSGCDERIEDQPTPVVVYIVAGMAPMHPKTKAGEVDLTDYAMPQPIRDLLAQQVARQDFCVHCFGKKFNLPLTTGPREAPLSP